MLIVNGGMILCEIVACKRLLNRGLCGACSCGVRWFFLYTFRRFVVRGGMTAVRAAGASAGKVGRNSVRITGIYWNSPCLAVMFHCFRGARVRCGSVHVCATLGMVWVSGCIVFGVDMHGCDGARCEGAVRLRVSWNGWNNRVSTIVLLEEGVSICRRVHWGNRGLRHRS